MQFMLLTGLRICVRFYAYLLCVYLNMSARLHANVCAHNIRNGSSASSVARRLFLQFFLSCTVPRIRALHMMSLLLAWPDQFIGTSQA